MLGSPLDLSNLKSILVFRGIRRFRVEDEEMHRPHAYEPHAYEPHAYEPSQARRWWRSQSN
jgi:hypothetical protein